MPTHVFGGSVGDAEGCRSTGNHVPAPTPACVTSASTRRTPPLLVPGSVTVAVSTTDWPDTAADEVRTSGASVSTSSGRP